MDGRGSVMSRARLPNRRPSESRHVEIDGRAYHVTVGFQIETGGMRPAEIFIRDAKEGSAVSFLLDDASVAISLALQHGVSPAALAKSIARLPAAPVMPADLDKSDGGENRLPASAIGAALDLLVELEREMTEVVA